MSTFGNNDAKKINATLTSDLYINVGVPSVGTGVAGPRGDKGYSAYEIAVRNGYTGTEAEWLKSLKGTIVSADTDSSGNMTLTDINGNTITTALKPIVEAKGYAEAAQTAQTAAEKAESGAGSSETAAANSATIAATQASNASTSATAAAKSASAAAASQTAAATSEANAKEYETNAGSSADLAKKWANYTDGMVDSSEYSAKHYAEKAETSASSAAENMQDTSNYATMAANHAKEAAGSAESAKTSETNAKTSEKNAATSEANAFESAAAAAESASAAADSANQAAAGQIQADWTTTDTTSKAFIKNKPEVYPKAHILDSQLSLSNRLPSINVSYGDASLHYLCATSKITDGSRPPLDAQVLHLSWDNPSNRDAQLAICNENTTLYIRSQQTNVKWSTWRKAVFDGDTVGKATADAAGNNIQTTYAKKSDLASSVSTKALTVTGETSVPTANEGNSSNTIASTEFVAKSLAKLVDSAPESLNTLNELAKALGNDPNFATTIINELGKKMNSVEAEDTFATKTEVGNYLPLSGGTMTGSITTSVIDFIKKTSNTSHVTLFGGTEFSNSASLMMAGGSQSYAPGYFELKAQDGANSSVLAGRPDGTLTWDNKDVERVNASGTNCIRYESGIQICWGTLSIPAGTAGREVSGTMTFPFPFANANYGLTFGNDWCASSSEYYRAEGRNTANFKFTAVGVGTNDHVAFYIAIGYWK